MKKLTSLFIATILIGVLTSPAWAAGWHDRGTWDAPVSWNNGHGKNWRGHGVSMILASGMVPAGQADPRTAVTPSGGSSQTAIACSTLAGGWANPIGRSNWVSLQADCTTGLSVTDFTYTTTFTLPTNRPGLSLTGSVLSDDFVTIQLNGHTMLSNGGGFTAPPTTFSTTDPSFFNAGTNTLTFIVHNSGGPSGLDYVASVHPGHGNANGQQGDNENTENDDNDSGD